MPEYLDFISVYFAGS